MNLVALWLGDVIIWAGLLLQIRNFWVSQKLTKHTAAASLRARRMFNEGDYDVRKLERMFDCFADYNTILTRFWIWDITKFVTDPVAYQLVYESNPELH